MISPKTGTITAPTGSDANLRSLGDTTPVSNTLAGLLRDAFAAATLNKVGVINLATRKVTILPAGSNPDAAAALTDNNGRNLDACTFTKDDASKASSPWTGDHEDVNATTTQVVTDALAAAKPARSVESLCNAIEGSITDPDNAHGGAAYSGIIVVDQAAGEVRLYSGGIADVASYDAAAAFAEEAAFEQTVTTPGSTQFGE